MNEAISGSEIAIITAPLRLSEPRWTSQDIADRVGVSQSAVARTWRKHYAQTDMSVPLPASVAITEVRYANGNGYIRFSVENASLAKKISDPKQLMRSPRRIACQTMLAALWVEAPTTAAPIIRTADENELLLTTDAQASAGSTHIRHEDWQHLLLWLIQSSFPTSAGNFRQLHQQLISWAKSPTQEFSWASSADLDKRAVMTTAQPQSLRTIQQVVADQCFEWVVDRIWSGDLTAGDRITETSLAKSLHTTRNQTRDALRALASAGLLDHHPARGVLVPTPTRTDIADIYAARRPLGELILRRTIANPHLDIEKIKISLDQMVDLAKSGNSYETGNADMRFQDTLAECSGMRNIPQMFGTLAKQIRIYIAVMGLSYVYSINDMVKDDTTIYRCIKARDTDGAIKAWNNKIDDVINYMSSKVTRK